MSTCLEAVATFYNNLVHTRKGSFNSKRDFELKKCICFRLTWSLQKLSHQIDLEPSKTITPCPTNQTTWIDTASETKKKKTEEMFGQISSIKSVPFKFFWFRSSYDGPFMFNMYLQIYRAGDVIIEQKV